MKTKLISRRKLQNRIRQEIKGSKENMEFQRDNTKNRVTTSFWEGAIFAEMMILDILKDFD